jgi:hypothetical protein
MLIYLHRKAENWKNSKRHIYSYLPNVLPFYRQGPIGYPFPKKAKQKQPLRPDKTPKLEELSNLRQRP